MFLPCSPALFTSMVEVPKTGLIRASMQTRNCVKYVNAQCGGRPRARRANALCESPQRARLGWEPTSCVGAFVRFGSGTGLRCRYSIILSEPSYLVATLPVYLDPRLIESSSATGVAPLGRPPGPLGIVHGPVVFALPVAASNFWPQQFFPWTAFSIGRQSSPHDSSSCP